MPTTFVHYEKCPMAIVDGTFLFLIEHGLSIEQEGVSLIEQKCSSVVRQQLQGDNSKLLR